MAQKVLYSKKVVEACEAIADHVVTDIGPHGRGSPPLWPISIIEVNWYLSRFLPKEIYTIVRRLENKGLSGEEIAKLFWGPSGVIHLLYCADFWFEGLTASESAEFIEKVVDFVTFHRIGDPFCRDWKNLIWPYDRVEKELATHRFFDTRKFGQEELGRILGKFNTILWQYCIFIQVGHRAYSHEFHGPYALGNGESLMVREYYNLKPTDVWEFTSEMPFDSVTTLEVYKDVEIRLDGFGHLDVSASLPANLRRLAILIDGQSLKNLEEFQDYLTKCFNVLQKGNQLARGFKKRDWVTKLLEMRCFWLKAHKDILGEDWKPSSNVLSLVERIDEAEQATGAYMQKMLSRVVGLDPEEARKRVTQMFLDNVYQRQGKGS